MRLYFVECLLPRHCVLVRGLGLGSGLGILLSDWLVVMHTYAYLYYFSRSAQETSLFNVNELENMAKLFVDGVFGLGHLEGIGLA